MFHSPIINAFMYDGLTEVFVICVDKERIILKPFIGTVTDHYVTSKHGSLGQGMRDIRYVGIFNSTFLKLFTGTFLSYKVH